MLLYSEPHLFGDRVAAAFDADTVAQPDVLLVMGTSLTSTRSNSLLEIINRAATVVRRNPSGLTAYVNNRPPPASSARLFDLHFSVDLDTWSKALLNKVQSSFLEASTH